MKLLELLAALHHAKNVNADVRVTNPDGTYNVGILTIEESGDGGLVIITEPIPGAGEDVSLPPFGEGDFHV